MPEFREQDHDCIVRTATKVNEHDRRLNAINGKLEKLNDGQDDLRTTMHDGQDEIKAEVAASRADVENLRGRLLTVAAAATVITSTIVTVVTVVINRAGG